MAERSQQHGGEWGSALPLAIGSGVIRLYRPEDRAMIRDICCKTAYRNRGSDALFEDRELIADYWTAYYTDHEPESVLVLEESGKTVGYLLGCVDARRHIRVMARQVMPGVLGRLLWRLVTGRYRQPQTYRMLRWWITSSWREMPHVPLDRYPAHYHCNILREAFGKRYYSTMALLFVERLAARGVPGLHGAVEEAAAGGPWTRMVAACHRSDLIDYLTDRPSTLLKAVVGEQKPMVNRVWGCTVDTYRLFLGVVASKFGI